VRDSEEVRIPREFLERAGLDREVQVLVRGDRIEIAWRGSRRGICLDKKIRLNYVDLGRGKSGAAFGCGAQGFDCGSADAERGELLGDCDQGSEG